MSFPPGECQCLTLRKSEVVENTVVQACRSHWKLGWSRNLGQPECNNKHKVPGLGDCDVQKEALTTANP